MTQAASLNPLQVVRETMSACMQCGTCSASCPNAEHMDLSPRQLWRLSQLGMLDKIAESSTYWMCSSCYTCTLRCPRGLPLTEMMQQLKRAVQEAKVPGAASKATFYRTFVDNIEVYGRIQETALMQRYFLRKMNPLLPLDFAGLGWKFLVRGKLHPPSGKHKHSLRPMFAKAREMAAAKTQQGKEARS